VTGESLRYDWGVALTHLAQADPELRTLTERYAGERLVPRGDLFHTLARSIVGQQISVKAAQTIWGRFLGVVGPLTRDTVLNAETDALRGAGLSARKVEYLRHVADSLPDLLATPWDTLSDEEAIRRFSELRGVGRWTAEMLLIFHLERPDVLPLGDVGLLRGAALLVGAEGKLSPSEVHRMGEAWRPYRSVATWLLWRALDPIPVEY
jgi:DNA-3-methyladenine glycosylase II